MGFDKTAFLKQKFEPRTAKVKVNSLRSWFKEVSDSEDCLWEVKGMTGPQLAEALEAANSAENLETIIKGIGKNEKIVSEIKNIIGIGTDTPVDIKKRLLQLTYCSVSPEVDMRLALVLFERFPIEFYTITNQITLLTGMGMDVKK